MGQSDISSPVSGLARAICFIEMVKRAYQLCLFNRARIVGFLFYDPSECFSQRLILQNDSTGNKEIAFRRLVVSKPKKNSVRGVADDQIDGYQRSQSNHSIQVRMV